jgi:hypothetical protein
MARVFPECDTKEKTFSSILLWLKSRQLLSQVCAENQGSNVLSQFSAMFANFWRKNWRFS